MPDPEVEKCIRDALRRIVAGEVRHPQLVALFQSGTLKVSYLSVALEAGISRTLIGYEGCVYQDVRDEITKAIQNRLSGPKGETVREKLKRQAARIGELEDEVALRDLERASALIEQWYEGRGLRADTADIKKRASPEERRSSMKLVRPSKKASN